MSKVESSSSLNLNFDNFWIFCGSQLDTGTCKRKIQKTEKIAKTLLIIVLLGLQIMGIVSNDNKSSDRVFISRGEK